MCFACGRVRFCQPYIRTLLKTGLYYEVAMTEEIRYKILKLLAENPDISQRELAVSLGISLGKTNFCLQALKQKGWVKVKNFKNNPDKRRYFYFLTPKGIEEKTKVTARFLKRKLTEYEMLEREIARLRKEVSNQESL